jgi:hypothetical protein
MAVLEKGRPQGIAPTLCVSSEASPPERNVGTVTTREADGLGTYRAFEYHRLKLFYSGHEAPGASANYSSIFIFIVLFIFYQ